MKKKDEIYLWLVTLGVFLTRIPFLWNGYGTEEDSWGLVINAWDIRETGHYVFSRLPGHPFQEGLLALFPHAGCFVYNLFSAFFSAVAVHFFIRIFREYGFRYGYLAGLALAFTPVFLISSTYTIDYCYALAFILAAWFSLLKKKGWLSGILLGLAVGNRLTSVIMIFPMTLVLWDQGGKSGGWRVIRFWCWAGIASLLVYAIPLMEFGTALISTYKLPYPPVPKALFKGSIGVWGLLGCIALALALIAIIRNRNKISELAVTPVKGPWQPLAWALAVLLNLIVFIRLPEKSAFLIPALPFLILLLAHLMKKRTGFVVFCLMTILSPFVLSINLTDKNRGAEHPAQAITFNVSGQEIFFDALSGPVMADYTKRKNKAEYCRGIISKMDTVSKPTLIIAGWWTNELVVRIREENRHPQAVLTAHAGESMLKELKNRGYQLYYLAEIDRINDRRYGHPFTAEYALPF